LSTGVSVASAVVGGRGLASLRLKESGPAWGPQGEMT